MNSGRPSDKPTDVGLIDGRNTARSERGNSGAMAQNCSSSRIWMVLAVAFFIISLALAIYVAYDKLSESDTQSDVLLQYPGYFRTPEEQAAVERQFEEDLKNETVTPAISVNETRLESCDFRCGNPAKRKRRSAHKPRPMLQWATMYMTVQKLQRKRRAVKKTPLGPPVYHGCCVSRHKFISPDDAENLLGATVKVVQFNDKRQYFPSQECKHAKGCHGCGCGQEDTLVTAVVKNEEYPDDSPDEFILNFIKLPGCCKCFNNLTPP